MKKISPPKINFRDILDIIISKLRIIVVVLSILVITGFGFFLYRDFYLTIISAREIVVLQNEVASTAINADELESATQKHKQKQSLPIRDWSNLQNIFNKTTDNTTKFTNDRQNQTNANTSFVKPKTSF